MRNSPTVTRHASRSRSPVARSQRPTQVAIDGRRQPLLDQPDVSAAWKQNAASEDSKVIQMVVPVEWLAKRPVEWAFREKGLFTSQVTACKLRDAHTIETVEAAFGLAADTG